ncbi:TetR/AcrR family transcriptional regulator [Nocardia cyriacigeorgica]|uniref:TetR/AcrR family transcriptional regulator n=1 Tax=Nocardia cyriacigeorgica TaxID=135487 RepID=UPI0024542CF6|nr:TetR/AcrR family transcriptional regulator [Nocardia cyriacigeorgica]
MPPAGSTTSERAHVRRQARGLRRREQILSTAEAVFAEVGFDRATTNLIAQRAEISPGSLYQFFRNKEEIACTLLQHYVSQLDRARADAVGAEGQPEHDLKAFLDRSVDRMVRFTAEHPGVLALFMRPDNPPELHEAMAPLQDSLSTRVHEVLTARAPHKPEADIRRYTLVALQIVRGVLPAIATSPEPEHPELITELKRALHSYLNDALQ